eukprot:TRINITY_DN2765_c0_g1_i4.p1 TRINITY_DN2765_c0_g1~~TRINITY_DN2765_c0_g1_i4.p1  ORF type:complete len:372 (+),score=87.65 TRINITY_DN2765_c0_g1_i4:220-1335(+)
MEIAPRTINMRIFCHNCKQSFNKLINPDDTSGLTCAKCKSDFVEILGKNQTAPPDPQVAPVESSPIRHGRYSSFLGSPLVLSSLANQSAFQSVPTQTYVQIERRPGGFTYIMTRPMASFQYQVYQAPGTSPEENKGASGTEERKEEKKEEKKEESKNGPQATQWHERMISQNLPAYMNIFMQDVQGMNWNNRVADPFSANFMDGLVFGRGFPTLRLNDFFAESDNFHPTNLGINLQDFGMNFASNFRHGNLIDLVQLISMAEQGSSGKPPASKEVVSKLPVFKVEEKHCKKGEDGKVEVPNCAICCNDINLSEKAQLLPCGHMFHPDCIKPWFMEHNTCPICRYELPTDDPYYEEIRKRNLEQRQEQRSEH